MILNLLGIYRLENDIILDFLKVFNIYVLWVEKILSNRLLIFLSKCFFITKS